MSDGRADRKFFTLAQKQEIIEMYRTHTKGEVIEKHGCSWSSIRDWRILDDHGLLAENTTSDGKCNHASRRERDLTIATRALAGERVQGLAGEFGIGRLQIYLIVNKHVAGDRALTTLWKKLKNSRKGGWGSRVKIDGKWVGA